MSNTKSTLEEANMYNMIFIKSSLSYSGMIRNNKYY